MRRTAWTAVILSMFFCSAMARATDNTITIKTSHFSIELNTDNGLTQLRFGSPDGKQPKPDLAYPPGGAGYIWEPALLVVHADGNTSSDLVFDNSQTQEISPGVTETRIDLKDPQYPDFVTLVYRAFADSDVIEQWMELHHGEAGPITLERFASSSPLITASNVYLSQFMGDYKKEMTWIEEKLSNGSKIIDSRLGSRADYYQNPSFFLSLGSPAQEDSGDVLGGTLAWAGSFQFDFEIATGRLRALCGMNPYMSAYHLKPGETFRTPPMLWTFSHNGKGQVSRNFHAWARQYALRNADRERPVLLNNWEATEFKFDENKIVSLFDGAKEEGAECFLLDDGWFGNKYPRNQDNAGLGDWQVNTAKLPHGISYLVDQAKQRGLRFGIWVEPEMVNPKSDLFDRHPEWAIQQPKRELNFFRNQLVLDLTRPEVRDFVFHTVDDLLTQNPGITYVKWDCNRYITQPGSSYLSPADQQNLWIDYVNSLYDIMSRVSANHPDVQLMACSGGGGRVDYGTLRYFDEFWPSDNTDPVSRVKIQWGYSQFFPAEAMACHITRMGNRPMKFAADVAMSGSLGMDMDLSKLSKADRSFLVGAVGLYKQFVRDIVRTGDLYRLESPYDGNRAALAYVLPDKSKALLFVYVLKDGPSRPVKIDGLDPSRNYILQEFDLDGTVSQQTSRATGQSLHDDGFTPSCTNALQSTVMQLTAE